jgi:hypothetical protein
LFAHWDSLWAKDVNDAISELAVCLPADTLLEDARLLTDPQLQNDLMAHPHRNVFVQKTHEISNVVQFLKHVAEGGGRLGPEVRKSHALARNVRKRGRRACAVDHCISVWKAWELQGCITVLTYLPDAAQCSTGMPTACHHPAPVLWSGLVICSNRYELGVT